MPNDKLQISNSKEGYTLIEILVAITIIAILFSLGYANFRDFARRQAIAGAAKGMQGDIILAQQLSLSGQKPTGVSCNPLNGYNFKIVSASQYEIQADCVGKPPVNYKTVDLPGGISISSSSLSTISFKVLAMGTNIPGGGNVALTLTQAGTNNKYVVTVGSGGDIQ